MLSLRCLGHNSLEIHLRPGTHNPRVVTNNFPPRKDNGFRAEVQIVRRHIVVNVCVNIAAATNV